MTERDIRLAEAVFGVNKRASSPRDFALSSKTEFIRTQYHIAIATPDALGFRLTAIDAFDQYGWKILSQLADYPAASLIYFPGEPFEAIRKRALGLQIDLEALQRSCGWTEAEIKNFDVRRPVGFRKLDYLAARLGLPSNRLGVSSEDSDNELSARLRTLLKDKDLKLSNAIVSSIVEAAWLAAKYSDLRASFGDRYHAPSNLRIPNLIAKIRRDSQIGPNKWISGSVLAFSLRNYLNINPGKAVRNVSSLIEDEFDILLVSENLDQNFTGCAVQIDNSRGIILNFDRTIDILIRRIALAHELCHVLFDTDAELASVRVDQLRIFDDNIMGKDRVEQRASLFAAEFLAPANAVLQMYDDFGGGHEAIIRIISHFGVSFAVVKWQLVHNEISISDDDSAAIAARIGPGTHQKWLSFERSIYSYVWNTLSMVRSNRINKLSLFAMHLYNQKLISKDSLTSILGYPAIDVDALAKKTISLAFASKLFKETTPPPSQ